MSNPVERTLLSLATRPDRKDKVTAMEQERKVKMLVYATEDERMRIKLAATKLGMSMTQFMLDTIMEQVASVEELEKKGAEGK